jgi:hypothetical protein
MLPNHKYIGRTVKTKPHRCPSWSDSIGIITNVVSTRYFVKMLSGENTGRIGAFCPEELLLLKEGGILKCAVLNSK